MADAAPPKQLGKYRPVRKLGAGGMGVVYLAEDVELGRTVALKVLPKRPDMPANLIARFRSEARAAARLHHPGIVTVFDSGETDRALYIALEYVDGKDVDRLLKTRERLPHKRATDLVRQIGEALVHLHEKGIVHRDIKPSNIMVRRDGSAVLADLGLARAVEEEAEGGITRAGYTVGTVDYMAPEQAKNSRNADVRSDLYSLACSWFHMLTGRIPYPGDSLTAKLSAHDNEPIPDPRSLHDDIPDSYVAVLQRAMAKNPADRYATPQEFLDDLELARRRRGSVSSDLLKDLADSHDDEDVAALLADQEDEAEAAARFAGGDEEDEDEAEDLPTSRRGRKKRRTRREKADRAAAPAGERPAADVLEEEDEDGSGPRRRPAKKRSGAKGPAARPALRAGELPVADPSAASDEDDSSPRRRKPAGASKGDNRGLNPLLIRNALIGGGVLVLLIGAVLLAAKFSGAFGGPPRVVDGPRDGAGEAAAAAASAAADATNPDDPKAEATLVREADDRPAPQRVPEDPAAAPDWVGELPAARGPEVTVVAGAADPNPTGAPRAASLAAALAELPAAGGTVTLRGVGPFTLPRLDLPEGADVRLRAGGGDEPIVNAAALPPGAAGWLRARGGSLTLENLHIVLPERAGDGPTPALIEAAAATAVLRGGSVTDRGDAPAVAVRAAGGGATAAHVLLDGTILRGNALTGVSLAGGPADLFAENCLLACGDGPAVAFPPDATASEGAARRNRPAARGGAVHFIAYRTAVSAGVHATAKPSAPRRSARFVNCVGVFRQAAVVVPPGPGGPPAVTLAGCAFGAAPGVEGVPLLSPPEADVKWTVQGGALAGLAPPASLEAPGRSAGWEGEPIANFAALDPARFAPAGLEVAPGAAPTGWSLPAPAVAARGEAGRRLPDDPAAWSRLFPDAPVVETTALRLDDELAKNHPDGTTLLVTGGRRVRLRPAKIVGRSLRIVGRAEEDGDTPLITASTAAGRAPTLAVEDGRLELINLTLEAREDRTGAGPLIAADGPSALAVVRRCELRAGSGDAAAVRVRGGAAVLTGTLLLGEGAAGLLEADGGGIALTNCGLVTPEPAVRFAPEGGGAVALTRCTISAGGPVFDASGGDGNAPAAVALTERCLFLPPPPGGPGRVALTAGGATVWGAANAFATAYAPPPTLGDGPPGPAGGERDARTGSSAVVLERPRVPDWKVVDAADLAPAAGSAAATDGLGAGVDLGPGEEVAVAGLPVGSKPATPRGNAPRPATGPNF
ncbi:protein kinase [Alienimonas sp. DA493]|uniref:serine/threonine-protein kinase n=1 Tax=Alienimonas sp. DA493 TaxID=3373605 RepID=UPI0037548DB6